MDKINRTAPPPCRLHGFLASEAPIGVLLRRGPSKQVQLIKWNTQDDTFEQGQWFKGRVYENWSDLSPDGTKFIYLATKHDGKYRQDAKIGYYYGVVCKPPYFTALAVWNGWKSGTPGYFLANNTLSRESLPLPVAPIFKPGKGRFPNDWRFVVIENKPHASLRSRTLERDGWILNARDGSHEKQHSSATYNLKRKQSAGNLIYSISMGSQIHLLERADWADIDQRERLVLTRDGKVFACEPEKNSIDAAIELADFNDSKFEPIAAPDWAKTW
ncbi:hypothetical protein CCAX7_24690 [Capsulimonas corticalis]|uniref:Uncharacterized protein n=1 Tax=Capsulimonas corticalis TaxID=2219043 RepID=A0A402CVI1_9BACT|nr:hypothetical protein [Capsulimonas corticalis]BDI30418.1 hypothetical protein CCAX7_24690 [Capsulimonas corticalis]